MPESELEQLPMSRREERTARMLDGLTAAPPVTSGLGAESLARAAVHLHTGTDIAGVAERAVLCAVDLVPGTHEATLTAVTGGVAVILASTTRPSTSPVDQAQSTAYRQPAAPPVRQPATAGPGCALSVSLSHSPAGTDWSLQLHTDGQQTFDADSQRLAQLLAAHISVAMTTAYQLDHLQRAIASRDVIGQAKGILMERHRLTADQAFQVLVRSSQSGNRKLHDIAADLTATGQISLAGEPAPSSR